MRKKVVLITQTPQGALVKYADGSEELLEGVEAQLTGEGDKDLVDDDGQEEMMSKMKPRLGNA